MPRLIPGANDEAEYSMEYSPSSEANSSSPSEEIPYILWKQQVPHHVHSNPPLFPILSQINPFYALHPVSLRYSLILSFHLPLDPRSGLFPSV